jgi:glutamate dehydrogenase (NAD(P)+)
LKGYERAQEMDNSELMAQQCDALIPCAASNQITKELAEKLQCRAIIEGANHPTTLDADQIILERDITLIPDIIANAGGLIVSYFEWVQDISALQWATERVQKELERIILNAFESVIKMKQDHAVSYRLAAHMLAVQKVATALNYRGIYP